MKNKVISIIIPGRNEAENLDELRLRLENLTRKIEKYNFEFIIIFPESTIRFPVDCATLKVHT